MLKSTESVSEYVYVPLSINLYIYICESVTDSLSLSKEKHLCVTGKQLSILHVKFSFCLKNFFDATDTWPVFNNTYEQDERQLSLYGELDRKNMPAGRHRSRNIGSKRNTCCISFLNSQNGLFGFLYSFNDQWTGRLALLLGTLVKFIKNKRRNPAWKYSYVTILYSLADSLGFTSGGISKPTFKSVFVFCKMINNLTFITKHFFLLLYLLGYNEKFLLKRNLYVRVWIKKSVVWHVEINWILTRNIHCINFDICD